MLLEKLCKSEANSRSTQRTDTRSTKPKMKKRKKKKREREKRQQPIKQNRQNQNQTKPNQAIPHQPAACSQTRNRCPPLPTSSTEPLQHCHALHADISNSFPKVVLWPPSGCLLWKEISSGTLTTVPLKKQNWKGGWDKAQLSIQQTGRKY